MKTSHPVHILVYAVLLGVVSSALMTGISAYTGPYKEANARADKLRNVLRVLEVPIPPETTAMDLVGIFTNNVRVEEGVPPRYVLSPAGAGGEVRAVAVAFEGQGLWGPVKGFMAMEPDMKTIRGIAFYQQEETPGLGGEIASDAFCSQFRGKMIRSGGGAPGIRITRGSKATAVNEVDGITGATMTCGKVETIINGVIGKMTEEQEGHD